MTTRKTASPRTAGAVLAIALGLWGLSPSTGWCQQLTLPLTAEDVAATATGPLGQGKAVAGRASCGHHLAARFAQVTRG